VADPIDRAITLFEHGRIEEAAHLFAVVRRSAVDAHEEERLAEIDDVIGQMQAHLLGHAREAFDRAVADESASTEPYRALRPGELRSIVQSVGVVASAGAVAILVAALLRWPDTLLYALLVPVAGPLLIVILSLPIAFVNSLRPRMSRRREQKKQVAPS
jgi:Flp pilus assembly protein TadB